MISLIELNEKVAKIESSLNNVGYSIKNAMTDDSKRQVRLQSQSEAIYGFQLALCVSTDDPLAQGRIKIYHPIFDLEQKELDKLPWARPVSTFGGLDDSGSFWVPPAGSKVVVFYHNGNFNDAFYMGTIWDRHRGPQGQHQPYWWFYPYMDEYNCLYEKKSPRNGYNFGDNTGDQVLPPWNTDAYSCYDWDETSTFTLTEEARRSRSLPHFYGMKTPSNKHYTKYVDGNAKCLYKGSRVEVASGRGNILVFKDDHLHPFSQYGFGSGSDGLLCQSEIPCCSEGGATPMDFDPNCPNPPDCVSGAATGCVPTNSTLDGSVNRNDRPSNPYQKRREENRFHYGIGTPEHPKVDLPQSGVYLGSVGGARLIFDDSVDQPQGVPKWSQDFDFGCNNKITDASASCHSMTGHFWKMSDSESDPEIRDENNGVFVTTAYGTYMKMSDHTIKVGGCECPSNFAGEDRGFEVQTTSTHLFRMNDSRLQNCGSSRAYSPSRERADQNGFEGYIMLRSGYGLQILMKDQDIQTETKDQFIQILAPQKDNTTRGPHFLIMQEQPSGPGFVLLRAGGVMYLNSYDDSIEVVGEEENPSNKFVAVTDNYLIDVKQYYFNHAFTHLLLADKFIYLLAGQDCPIPGSGDSTAQSNNSVAAAQGNPGGTDGKTQDKGPCPYTVITDKDPWACPFTGYVHYGIYPGAGGDGPLLDSRSHRVFASAFDE